MSDEYYMLEHFIKDQFVSLEWSHVIVALDAFIAKIAQTKFCDK